MTVSHNDTWTLLKLTNLTYNFLQGCRGNVNENHIYPMGIPIVNPMGILWEILWEWDGNGN